MLANQSPIIAIILKVGCWNIALLLVVLYARITTKITTMDNKHELTENLKAIEAEIYDHKVGLKGIELKLQAAYQYQDELSKRMVLARQKTESLKQEFFVKCTLISQKYDKMKSIMDIFSGNFYNHDIKP